MFTDNMVTEGAYYKGKSPAQDMYQCTLSLKDLEMEGGFLIHVIHCAGTRMIAQGTDRLSRGVMWEGFMRGTPMSAYIPLHESPLQRDPLLQNWFCSWWEPYGTPFEVLTPEGWFTTAHSTGCFL